MTSLKKIPTKDLLADDRKVTTALISALYDRAIADPERTLQTMCQYHRRVEWLAGHKNGKLLVKAIDFLLQAKPVAQKIKNARSRVPFDAVGLRKMVWISRNVDDHLLAEIFSCVARFNPEVTWIVTEREEKAFQIFEKNHKDLSKSAQFQFNGADNCSAWLAERCFKDAERTQVYQAFYMYLLDNGHADCYGRILLVCGKRSEMMRAYSLHKEDGANFDAYASEQLSDDELMRKFEEFETCLPSFSSFPSTNGQYRYPDQIAALHNCARRVRGSMRRLFELKTVDYYALRVKTEEARAMICAGNMTYFWRCFLLIQKFALHGLAYAKLVVMAIVEKAEPYMATQLDFATRNELYARASALVVRVCRSECDQQTRKRRRVAE